jgi:hypothetical protein
MLQPTAILRFKSQLLLLFSVVAAALAARLSAE